MNELVRWILSLMLTHAPPGVSAFSVTPASECVGASSCTDARWSEHYGTWVRRETHAEGAVRYSVLAEELAVVVRGELCQAGDGSELRGCRQWRSPEAPGLGPQRWHVGELVRAVLAAALLESGLREDVQTGRGSARKASQDGGRGRGGGGEACLVQAHPQSAWRYLDGPPELRARAKAGDRAARDELVRGLLGREREAVRLCWRVGVRQLLHARRWCSAILRDASGRPLRSAPTWTWQVFALYGSGSSCYGDNGKTELRHSLFFALGETRRPPIRERVLVIGDSIAQGLGSRVCAALPGRACEVDARVGSTAGEWVASAGWLTLYDHVVVSLGTNDCRAPRAREVFDRRVTVLRLAGPHVVFLRPPASCPEIDAALDSTGAVLEPPALELADGLHPDAAGYKLWASQIAAALE